MLGARMLDAACWVLVCGSASDELIYTFPPCYKAVDRGEARFASTSWLR